MTHRPIAAVLLLLVLPLAGCSDDSSPARLAADATADSADAADTTGEPDDDAATLDDGTDVDAQPDVGVGFEPIARTVPDEGHDPDGHPDVTERLGPGEVRAGRVAGWNHGFAGVEADCRPGDYKIYNSEVEFCVAGLQPINLFTYTGGQVVDADRIGANNDRLLLIGPQNQINVGGAETIEVIADGSQGRAVIRVIGPEHPIRLISDLVGLLIPFRGVSFETEYRLDPDVAALEMVTWVRAEASTVRLGIGDLVIFGDSTTTFTPGYGRDRAPAGDAFPFISATGEGRSYGLYHPGGIENENVDFSQILASDYLGVVEARGAVEPGQEGVLRRYLIVGDGGTADIRRAIDRIDGVMPPEQGLHLTVTEAGQPASSLVLLVRDGAGSVRDALRTDDVGEAELGLPPGDYSVAPEDWIGGALDPIALTVEAGQWAEVTVRLPEAARLSMTIRAQEPGADALVLSPGKVMLHGPRDERLFVHDGRLDQRVRPGTYDIVVSRGEEFTAEVLDDVTLAAGDNEVINVTLERVWDTAGLISGEFHQHATPSPDSVVSLRDRVLSNLVEGVDFVVPSDHEAVTDLSPIIAELDVGALLYAMPSTEVSPLFGHLNPMPMPFDPALPAGGAYPKTELLLEEHLLVQYRFERIVKSLRDDYRIPVIQVNHPRDGFAVFDTGGYDPIDGPEATLAGRFSTDFDSLEVFNARGPFCRVFRDWSSLLARGFRITGVGNSDTHSLSTESGYPRSYLASAATAATMTDDDIVSALLAGDASVSGGALITLPEGPSLGSTWDVSGAPTFELPVRIQTPVWSSVDELIVVIDGRVVRRIEVEADDDAVVAFDDTLELATPERDTYLILVAWSRDGMDIVYPGEEPFGFTNPVYLDVDGDDDWTPPGVAGAEDLPVLGIPWCN